MGDAADVFPMWVLYKKPRDYPQHYVARLWHVGRKGAVATSEVITALKIDALREALPPGLVRLKRDPSDAKEVVEVWL